MSPLPGEHSCRLAPPGDFREFARKNEEQESEGRPIDVIYGIKMKDGKRVSEIQSLRYKTEEWEEDQAKKHCQGRKGEFEPAEEEVKVQEATSKTTLTETYFFASPVSLGPDEHLVDIEILRSGEWRHPKAPGGILTLPKAKLEEFKENFDLKILGEDLPLDIDHKPAKTGAVGWLKRMWINTKENVAHLFARLDITDPDTQEAVRNGNLKYFSPQIETDYEDPETGKIYDIIRSGALTAWPYIKGMQPAKVLNFSEIEGIERKIEGKKKAEILLAKDNEITTLKEASRIVTQQLIKTNKQVALKDRVIQKIEMKARIDNLVSCGDLSPYEGQEMRSMSLSEPKSVELAITLLQGRGKAWQPGQISILSPKKGSSRLGLTELQQAVDKEKDPARHDQLLELLDNRIAEMKQARGIK